jgi:predicted HD superfamily hydrolase involved in NAD metabolism
MAPSDLRQIEDRLRRELAPEDFSHCQRTAETAARLAEMHSADRERARLAGLVHDVAKGLGDEALLSLAVEHGLPVNSVERKKPYLLHAAVGVKMLISHYGVGDRQVLQAVERHTFGARKMSKLDKIIYLADVIEPARDFEGLERVRRLAETDLDAGFAAAYQGQVISIVRRGGYLHPQTLTVWNEVATEVGKLD